MNLSVAGGAEPGFGAVISAPGPGRQVVYGKAVNDALAEGAGGGGAAGRLPGVGSDSGVGLAADGGAFSHGSRGLEASP